jgi:hypothetical protein
MTAMQRTNLWQDFVLPTVLFAALGGMTWAVRGSSGFGGSQGCIFAGVTWGAAWWFIAREPGARQLRRYSSGWIVLAMTLGIGYAGGRGWAQWHHFFDGRLETNASTHAFVAISPVQGFVWLFIAGVPWAGLGACTLAWCGPKNPTSIWLWIVRFAFGIGAVYSARYLFQQFPQIFLPNYDILGEHYYDWKTNPSLRRVINDNRAAITHLALYLGFLAFEIIRRDWRNVVLILTVGVLNGIGWSLLQNWTWADRNWPGAFNWWRCWESTGGMSIGIAFGVAYYLVNRKSDEQEQATINPRPNLERFGLYLGLILGLAFSIRNGLKGWSNIYIGNEEYWSRILTMVIGPTMLIAIAAVAIYIVRRPRPRGYDGDIFPHAHKLIWTVLIIQNILAQLVTHIFSSRSETAFNLFYIVLFIISGTIVYSVHTNKNKAS